MISLKRCAFAAVIVAGSSLGSVQLQADAITFIIDDFNTAPGEFAVYAAVDGDSFGLADFELTLVNADSVQNVSPAFSFDPDIGGSGGFDTLRFNSPLSGSQNLFAGAALFTGIGQMAGSIDPNHDATSPVNVDYGGVSLGTFDYGSFAAPVLLATGTWSGNPQDRVAIDTAEGLVFRTSTPTVGDLDAADDPEEVRTTYVAIPEPSSAILAGLALCGVGLVRRKFIAVPG